MILGSGLLTSGTPSFGTVTADSSDSALFSGYTPNVATIGPVSRRLYFGKSGGTWKTLWTDTTGALLRGDEAGTYAVTKASDGPAPFATDTGLATDSHAGAVSAGTTFTHESDFVAEAALGNLQGSGSTQIFIRQTDSTHYWLVSIDAAGTLYLYERDGGTPATRAVVGGAFTGNQRLVIICDDESIKIYVDTTIKVSYGFAANFKTATVGYLNTIGTGSTVSNLYTWPRTLSGTAATILNKVSA